MTVKRLTTAPKPATAVAPTAKLDLTLAEVNSPPEELRAFSMLIYGSKKIGKTTLASRFPNPYFLALEPGTKALRVRSSACPTWSTSTRWRCCWGIWALK